MYHDFEYQGYPVRLRQINEEPQPQVGLMMDEKSKKKGQSKFSTSIPKYIKIKTVVPLRRVLGLPPVRKRS